MRTDLTKINETDWLKLCRLKKLSLGAWEDIELVCKCLEAMPYNNLYHKTRLWVLRRLINSGDSCRTIGSRWAQYQKVDAQFSLWIKEHFDIENDYLWDPVIPKHYRYIVPFWWQDLLYGISGFYNWCNNEKVLRYYTVLYRLEHAVVEDMAELWSQYQKLYQALQMQLESQFSKARFWHWVFKDCLHQIMTRLKQEQDSISNQIRTRLLEQDDFTVLKLLMDETGYAMLSHVLNDMDLERLVQGWRLRYPKWMVVYKVRSQSSISEEEKREWKGFDVVYFKECLRKNDGYLYGRLIERLLVKEDRVFVSKMFSQTIEGYTDFWYQLRDWLCVFRYQKIQDCLEALFSNWYYSRDMLSILSVRQINLSKVPWDVQTQLIHRYYEAIDGDLIKRYKLLLEDLTYQIRIGISYRELRSLQVIWKSIDLVYNLPSHYRPYVSSVVKCLKLHVILEDEIALKLQAYMITIGRYQWPRRWQGQDLEELVCELSTIDSVVWQQGISIMKVDIQNNRRKYDSRQSVIR